VIDRRQVALVAGREIRELARSRAIRWVTAVLVVAALAVVVIPGLVGDDGPERSTIAVVEGPEGLGEALVAAGRAQGREVELRRLAPAAAEAAAADGRVDAAVRDAGPGAPVRVTVDEELPGDLRAVIVQAVAIARVSAALEGAGVPAARAAEVVAPPSVEVSARGDQAGVSDGDITVGIIVAVVLYVALLFAGTIVATGVAEEKASRVSEVLLASLRPSELLMGKVVGVGIVAIAQLALIAAPSLVAALALDQVELPGATGSTVAVGLVWFLAGYVLYSFAYGGLGALVARQQEVGSVTAPLALLLLAGYLLGTFAAAEPEAGWVTPVSLLPPFAPMMMPVRVATDSVGAGELLLALALTLAAAAALVAFGARVYRAGITRSGPRVPLREALAARGR
jgi:ABC-2 type transport system permease protein